MLLPKMGIAVVDADKCYSKVIQPGSSTLKAIEKEFGSKVINDDGTLNRGRLGDIIFQDEGCRRRLNGITHPAVTRQMLKEAAMHFITGKRVIVLDIPLLYETGVMLSLFNKVICVYCNPEQELARLMQRNTLTKGEAEQRMASQMSLEEKCRQADIIIDNSGTLNQLEERVHEVVLRHLQPSFIRAHATPLLVIVLTLAFGWM
eukprot:Ihof_evm2s762 gene=Ihof_evmTU2s762